MHSEHCEGCAPVIRSYSAVIDTLSSHVLKEIQVVFTHFHLYSQGCIVLNLLTCSCSLSMWHTVHLHDGHIDTE